MKDGKIDNKNKLVPYRNSFGTKWQHHIMEDEDLYSTRSLHEFSYLELYLV